MDRLYDTPRPSQPASRGWGFNWPVTKYLLTEVPPLTIRGATRLLVVLLLAAIAVLFGQSLRVGPALWPKLWLYSFLNVSCWMTLMVLALIIAFGNAGSAAWWRKPCAAARNTGSISDDAWLPLFRLRLELFSRNATHFRYRLCLSPHDRSGLAVCCLAWFFSARARMQASFLAPVGSFLFMARWCSFVLPLSIGLPRCCGVLPG